VTIRDICVAFGVEVDNNSVSAAENSIKGLKNMATKLLGTVAVAFSVTKLSSFASDCVAAASDVQEMENKFNTVFDSLSGEVDEWAENFADSVGRNKNTIKTYLADQQNLLVGFGMTRDEGAKLSEEMTSLALDIASFANQDEDVAVNAMTKAVMGESEAAKTLGAVLNDSTRAETMAAMGLSGTYDKLTQLEKMQVNYNAILRQSPDAVGDCVRSMGSYESSTRSLKAAQEEFKEFIGTNLLPVMSVFVQVQTKMVKGATSFANAILLDAEGNNRILLSFNRIQAVVKRLQPAMERFTSSMKNGINKATDTVKNIVDKMGGMDKALKLLAIVAATFIARMKWLKMAKDAEKYAAILKTIKSIFSTSTLKAAGFLALMIILALIVEDFINFLMGNDSVIGTVFDRLGIGADNARQVIFDTFGKVKDFLDRTWEEIKAAVDKHGGSIKQSAQKAFGGILTIAEVIFTTLVAIAYKAFGGLGDVFDNIDLSTPINAVVSTIDVLVGVLGSAGDYISKHKGLVSALVKAYGAFKIGSAIAQVTKLTKAFGLARIAKAKDLAETIYLKALYAKDFAVSIAKTTVALAKQAAQFALTTGAKAADAIAQGAMTAATLVWNGVATVAAAVTAGFGAAVAFLTSPIGLVIIAIAALIAIGILLYKNWDKVTKVAGVVWGKIKSLFTAGANKVKGIMSGMKTNVTGIVKGIKTEAINLFQNTVSGISKATGKIKTTVSNGFQAAITWIKQLPSQSVKWGSDIIDGLVKGIGGAASKVTSAVKGVAKKIKSFLHFSVPDEGPLTDYESWMPDFMGGLAEGIEGSESKVLEKVKNLADGISVLMNGATATAATAASSQINNTTSNMTQNVNINNSYTGGTTETQKNVSRAMKKSATDATTQMARGLAYARG
jgi:hypothetical protein